ncbi:MAG: hypothetical protein WC312_04560, partial [Candidatus Omnitrophota bacterium]
MTNFKKVFNHRVILILMAAIFLLNSTAYCINIPAKASLRKPLDFKYSHQRFIAALKTEEKLKNKQLWEKVLETIFKPDSSLPIMKINGKINLKEGNGAKIALTSYGFLQDEGKRYLEYALRIKQVRFVEAGAAGSLYVIEDTNGNKFLTPEDGAFLAISVETASGDFFIKLDRLHANQLMPFIMKAWDNFEGPKDLKLEGKFLYTSAFSPEMQQILADRLVNNPIT